MLKLLDNVTASSFNEETLEIARALSTGVMDEELSVRRTKLVFSSVY
jgi:hypothetical protein